MYLLIDYMRHSSNIRVPTQTIETLGKFYPYFVSNVEQVEGAGQLHLRLVSRAISLKLFMLGAEQRVHCLNANALLTFLK